MPGCRRTGRGHGGAGHASMQEDRGRGGAGRTGLQEEDRWRWLDWGEGEQEDDRRCRLDGEQLVAAGGVEEVGPEDRRVVLAGGDGGRLGGFLWAGAETGWRCSTGVDLELWARRVVVMESFVHENASILVIFLGAKRHLVSSMPTKTITLT
jgi:hypothetical protein